MLFDKEFIPNPWLRPIPKPDILRNDRHAVLLLTQAKQLQLLNKIYFKQMWKKLSFNTYDSKATGWIVLRAIYQCRAVRQVSYLLMVKGWRAGCCFGIQMMLGELRLGLPRPELPILLVLPPILMPWPTCEWFIMFLEFIGRMPLQSGTYYIYLRAYPYIIFNSIYT